MSRRRSPKNPKIQPPPAPEPDATDEELATVVDDATDMLRNSEHVGRMFAERCSAELAQAERDRGWIGLALEMWKSSTSAHGQHVAKILRALHRETSRHANALAKLELELELHLVHTSKKEQLEPREKYLELVTRAFEDGPETLVTPEILS